jgi:hypothetical protein
VILAIGGALQVALGLFSWGALGLLLVGLGAAGVYVLGASGGGRQFERLLAGAVVVQAGLGLVAAPFNDVVAVGVMGWLPHRAFYLGAGVLGVAGVAGVRWRWSWVVGAGLFLVMAGNILRCSPSPRVDVFVYQRDGAAALVRGNDPYELTFRNPYTPSESWVFAPGTAEGGRILFGFPYFPIELLTVLPAAMLGDYRWAHVAALLATAGGLAVLGRGAGDRRAGGWVALLFLTTPRLPFAVEWGWTEPVLCALFVWTLVAVQRRGWARVLLGATLMLSKQYVVLLVPLGRWLGVTRRNVWWGLVPVGITAAFAAWDPRAFWESTVALQFRQPFRPDALSLPAAWFHLTGQRLPGLLGPIAGCGVSAAMAVWGGGRRGAGDVGAGEAGAKGELGAHRFAVGSAVSLLIFFALSKQAFANYYVLVIAAWCAVLVLECQSTTSSSSAPASAG